MTFSCKLCGHQINSLRPGDKAIASVIDQLMLHLAQDHKQDGAELAARIAAVSGYLAVRLYARIPETERELLRGLAEIERELFALISGDVITRLRDVMMEKPRGGQGGAN